jgi:hypothetical protein
MSVLWQTSASINFTFAYSVAYATSDSSVAQYWRKAAGVIMGQTVLMKETANALLFSLVAYQVTIFMARYSSYWQRHKHHCIHIDTTFLNGGSRSSEVVGVNAEPPRRSTAHSENQSFRLVDVYEYHQPTRRLICR